VSDDSNWQTPFHMHWNGVMSRLVDCTKVLC